MVKIDYKSKASKYVGTGGHAFQLIHLSLSKYLCFLSLEYTPSLKKGFNHTSSKSVMSEN